MLVCTGGDGVMNCYSLQNSSGSNSSMEVPQEQSMNREQSTGKAVNMIASWSEMTETLRITLNQSLDAGYIFTLAFSDSTFPLR